MKKWLTEFLMYSIGSFIFYGFSFIINKFCDNILHDLSFWKIFYIIIIIDLVPIYLKECRKQINK